MRYAFLALFVLVGQAMALGVVHDYYPGDVMVLKPEEVKEFNILLQNEGSRPEKVELMVTANESISIKTSDPTYPYYTVPASSIEGEGKLPVRLYISQPGFYEFFVKSKIQEYVNVTYENGVVKPLAFTPVISFKLRVIHGDNNSAIEPPLITSSAIANVSKDVEVAPSLTASLVESLIDNWIVVFLAAITVLAVITRGRKDDDEGEKEKS